ncbi:MAG: hypothetical protein J5835_07150 [Bacteroidales bacterium]|nr:hypothetical protein [Bacteroidales bacterium]
MRTWRITKDIIFIIIAVMLIATGRFLPILFGLVVITWYGWDLYHLVRAMVLEKKAAKAAQSSTPSPSRDDGRITLTNKSDIREVNYEKE